MMALPLLKEKGMKHNDNENVLVIISIFLNRRFVYYLGESFLWAEEAQRTVSLLPSASL